MMSEVRLPIMPDGAIETLNRTKEMAREVWNAEAFSGQLSAISYQLSVLLWLNADG